MSRSGQVLIEHLLALFGILLPLFLGICTAGMHEYRRSRCALRAFQLARQELILRDAAVEIALDCEGSGRQEVRLKPLRELDRGGDGLSLEDWVREVNSLWEPLWSLSPPSEEPDSGS